MKPPVELVRPTLLNIIAIICYLLAILFHIIAYATNGWSSLVLSGVRWDMGLWEGCRDMNGTRYCTNDVFDDEVFKTGKSSNWHIGSRIMMTMSLILLFVLEFALLGYAFIQRLQRYKSKLVGFIIAVSLSAGILTALAPSLYDSELKKNVKGPSQQGWSVDMAIISGVLVILAGLLVCANNCREKGTCEKMQTVFPFCEFLVLIMYGSEVGKVEDSSIKGTFAFVVLTFLLELALPMIVYVDKTRRFPGGLVFIDKFRGKSKSKSQPQGTGRTNRGYSDHPDGRSPARPASKPISTIEDKSSTMRRSQSSLSEADTYRRFAYLEVEGPSANPSTMSLGSMTSINTRSEAHTQVSYLTDKDSAESLV